MPEDGVLAMHCDAAGRDLREGLGAGMGNRLSLVLKNQLSELERMSEAVAAWCEKHAVCPAAEFQVTLALDEIVSNVIHHGWKDKGEHCVWVHISRCEDELRVAVEDDAAPFNPLEAPVPDMEQPLEERTIGGLGIHLVRQCMDGLEYRRREGRNVLLMRKRLVGTS